MGWFNKKELAEIERLNTMIDELNAPHEKIPKELYGIRDENISKFYRVQRSFLTSNELKAFKLLSKILTDETFKKEFDSDAYYIFSKVKLMDIIEFWPDSKSWEKLANGTKTAAVANNIKAHCPDIDNNKYLEFIFKPISSLHVDFLICKISDDMVTPVLIIELNGSEHDDFERKGRNNDKIKALILNRVSQDSQGTAVFYKPEFKIIHNEDLDQPGFYGQLVDEVVHRIRSSEVSIKKYLQSRPSQPDVPL